MDLHQWGYTSPFPEAFEALARPDLVPGRIARHDRTGYLVVHAEGEAFARLPGHLREEPPATGDWVALDLADPPAIRAVLPRRTALTRQAADDEARAQVVAANLDVLFVVAGLDAPVNERRIERYLVLARSAGVEPVVVLNKTDVGAGEYPGALRVSAATGEGVDALRRLVPPGVTAAFVGPSGVGKSSLVNALLGAEALETGAVRDADKKGRHTTTARHIVPLPGGGALLDTPGMRELALWDAQEGVAATFDDVGVYARECRFSDCRHETEPGCAVRANVPPERLAAWRKLAREADAAARRADVAKQRRAERDWGRMARDTMRAKRERYRG